MERLQEIAKRLKARPVEDYLVLLAGLLTLLVAVQAVRFGVAKFQDTALQQSLARIAEPPPSRADVPEDEKFKPILAKGLLAPPMQDGPAPDVRLFGVLGKSALLGAGPGAVQLYEAGASLPGNEKLISIGIDSVTLEKDGKQVTLKVFDQPKGPEGRPEEPPSPPEQQDQKDSPKPEEKKEPAGDAPKENDASKEGAAPGEAKP